MNLGAGTTVTTGALTQSYGQVAGAGDLTVTGAATIDYGSQSGAGTTTLRGATTIGELYLDGGRDGCVPILHAGSLMV